MKCYYAHPITTYGTQQEKDDIRELESLGFDVVNPNSLEYEAAYKVSGMQVFLNLVDQCDCVIFKSFDFDGANIPAGVWKEICRAFDTGKPVLEIPGSLGDREMSVEQTRKVLGR